MPVLHLKRRDATPPGPKMPIPATSATGRRSWPTGNLAISLLHLAGVTEITRTLQAVARDRNRILNYLPL